MSVRSQLAKGNDCDGRAEVQNSNTVFLDASYLYGSEEKTATSLRTFHGGLLKVSEDNRKRHFPPIDTEVPDSFKARCNF